MKTDKNEDKMGAFIGFILLIIFIYFISKSIKYLDILNTVKFCLEMLFYLVVIFMAYYAKYSKREDILLEKFEYELSCSKMEDVMKINFEYPKAKSKKTILNLLWHLMNIMNVLAIFVVGIAMATYLGLLGYSIFNEFIGTPSLVSTKITKEDIVIYNIFFRVSLIFLITFIPNMLLLKRRTVDKAILLKRKYIEKYRLEAKD
jgi:hypothetical protein